MKGCEAKDYCKADGGKLVEIDSEEENTALVEEMKRRGLKDRKFWIGLTDRESHGEWILETSRLKPSYLNWAPKVMIAHLELCQDNRPLNLLAINCNHLVSKNNCN